MHYIVAVITEPGQNVDDLLKPFNENMDVEPYIEQYKEDIIAEVRENEAQLLADMEEAYDTGSYVYIHFYGDPYSPYEVTRRIPTLEEIDRARDLVENSTDEEAWQRYVEEDSYSDYDSQGNKLSTYNPNSKWDWYEVGGRWNGFYKTRDGETVNQCLIGELDYNDDMSTYAVLTPDGEWYEKDEDNPNSWYNSYYNDFIAAYPDDYMITAVDIHI